MLPYCYIYVEQMWSLDYVQVKDESAADDELTSSGVRFNEKRGSSCASSTCADDIVFEPLGNADGSEQQQQSASSPRYVTGATSVSATATAGISESITMELESDDDNKPLIDDKPDTDAPSDVDETSTAQPKAINQKNETKYQLTKASADRMATRSMTSEVEDDFVLVESASAVFGNESNKIENTSVLRSGTFFIYPILQLIVKNMSRKCFTYFVCFSYCVMKATCGNVSWPFAAS